MSDIADIIERLGSVASHRNAGEQARIIREVADLFISNQPAYSTPQVELFDRVMMKMIAHVDLEVRAYLSETLAPLDSAPREIIKTLANDDAIHVAGPVLTQSRCL